ncbi:MAG TPA: hypothetical protein VK842_09415, partial [bacterium]|nr:hypothetical protein [bacterium]
MPFKTSLAAKREAWFVLGSLLILSAAPLALFLPVFLSDKLIYGFDVYTCHLPYRAEIQRSLDAHHWPLWLPGLLGGMPGIASCNLYFLYPSDLIATLAGWPVRIQFALD